MAEIGRVDPADRETNPKKWEKVKAVWIDRLSPTELKALPGETLIIVLDRYDIEDLVEKGRLYFEPNAVCLLYARPELAEGKRGFREAETELFNLIQKTGSGSDDIYNELYGFIVFPELLDIVPDGTMVAVLEAKDIETLKTDGRIAWKGTLFIYDNR